MPDVSGTWYLCIEVSQLHLGAVSCGWAALLPPPLPRLPVDSAALSFGIAGAASRGRFAAAVGTAMSAAMSIADGATGAKSADAGGFVAGG